MMPEILQLQFRLYARRPVFGHRVKLAQARVTDWLTRVKNPYVAFSTGKDSTCCLHLVRMISSDVPAVYFDAASSFPESREMLANTPTLIMYQTDEPILQTLARHGLEGGKSLERATMQTTVWGPIKRLISEYGFDGVCYGLRGAESYQRKIHGLSRGSIFQYKRDGIWGCQPIWDWTYDDVWAYILDNEIQYCGTYDRLWDMPREDQRLSYWAGETKRRHGRYAWLKRNYPELFNKLACAIPEVRHYV
jgi:phosphoadenosine phosphosulfate reductase